MLLKTEEGEVINLAHVATLHVGELTRLEGNNAKHFYIEASLNSYYKRENISGTFRLVVARTETREESERILNNIVDKFHGLNLSPAKNAASEDEPQSDQSFRL